MAAPLSLVPEATVSAPRAPEKSSEATWLLCAGAHMFDDVCDWTVEHFRKDPHHAVAPSYSVDAALVLHEARMAWRRKTVRDVLLAGVMVGVVVAVASVARPDARLEVTLALVVATVALTAVISLLRSLGVKRLVHLAGKRYTSRKGTVVDDVAVTLLLATFSLWYLISGLRAIDELAVIAAALPLAWVVVAVDHFLAVGAADRLTTVGPQSTRSVRDDELARLREIQRPNRNLVVYRSSRGYTQPFVGSGVLLHSWPINVDVGRGKPGSDGNRATPGVIDPAEVHRRIVAAALRSAVPKLWCGQRTYVDGHSFRAASRRPADPAVPGVAWPYARAEGGERLAGLRGPELCRDYVCVQIPSWGDMIVTLLLRAELVGANLHLTNKICLLPPLSRTFHEMALDLPRHHLSRITTVTVHATRRVLPLLFRSPVECVRAVARPGWRLLRRATERYRIRLGSRFDFGALYSAREWWQTEHLHSNAIDDLERHVSLLQTELTSTIREYLDEQGVDTAVLEQSITAMFHSQQNTFSNIGNLAFGRESYAGDTNVNFTRPTPTAPTPAAGSSGGQQQPSSTAAHSGGTT